MTAVEIFFNDLVNQGFIEYKDDSLVQNIFNAALEMEKQQIIDAYEAGYQDGDAILGYEYFDNSESYYNKTYKNNYNE
jgi:hypothetical protein